MLTEGIKVCNKIGIREVLVSCDKQNIASAGVIKNCGGLLKEEFYSQTYDKVLQMYVIKHEN
jgi:predicted acetyltransferase